MKKYLLALSVLLLMGACSTAVDTPAVNADGLENPDTDDLIDPDGEEIPDPDGEEIPDGESWQYIGDENGISKYTAQKPSLVMFEGKPVVSYIEGVHSYAVQGWNGTSWEYMGYEGMYASSPLTGSAHSLAVWYQFSSGSHLSLYFAYNDSSKSLKATVQKWDGTKWQYTGIDENGISEDSVYNSISLNKSNPLERFIAYYAGASRKLVAMRETYNVWNYVGDENGMSAATVWSLTTGNVSSHVSVFILKMFYNVYKSCYKLFSGVNCSVN